MFHGNETFSQNDHFSQKEKISRNEPGSRISSNLRAPDHLGWVPGQQNRKNRSGIVFFERFSRFLKLRNDPGMIPDDFGKNVFRRCSLIFVGIFGGSPDFRRKVMTCHDIFTKSHDLLRKVMFFTKSHVFL